MMWLCIVSLSLFSLYLLYRNIVLRNDMGHLVKSQFALIEACKIIEESFLRQAKAENATCKTIYETLQIQSQRISLCENVLLSAITKIETENKQKEGISLDDFGIPPDLIEPNGEIDSTGDVE